MSHEIDEDPPIKTKHASQEYRDNWDRVFGEPEDSDATQRIHTQERLAVESGWIELSEPKYACSDCCDTGCVMKKDVDPNTVQTESDLLEGCTAREPENKSGFVSWPEDQPKRYNACTDPCDMWTGPCACGAWHHDGK